tara:strand:- start:3 stop:314 length:312 start_codon:yes stop_codon:yes gene_type:complete
MVFERFEVVAAPVEERLVDGIASQFTVLLQGFQSRFNHAQRVAADKQTVESVTRSAVKLVLPGSVPFLLFVSAMCLRVLYTVLVRLRSRRMLERTPESAKKVD